MFLILDKDKYQVRPLTNMSDTVLVKPADNNQKKQNVLFLLGTRAF